MPGVSHACKFPFAKGGVDRHCVLSPLDFEREHGIHNGPSTIHMHGLSSDEAGFVHAEQHYGIADVRGSPYAAHGCPPAFVPPLDGVEHFGWESAHDTIFGGARTDYIHGDPPLGQGYRKIAGQRIQRRFSRTHSHPRLPTSRKAAWRITDCNDSPTVRHDPAHQLRLE